MVGIETTLGHASEFDDHERGKIAAVPADERRVLQYCAFFFCIAFGFAMIANNQTPADGVWYWYAYYLEHGKRLYADMHVPLQPSFMLETKAVLAIFGRSWLASKIPAIIHLLIFCVAWLLLVRRATTSDARKAILLLFAFSTSISCVAFSFNDYRAPTYFLIVASILTLLALRDSTTWLRDLFLILILGVMSGIAVTTRPNDGAALAFGVFLGISFIASRRKVRLILAFWLTAGVTALIVISLTGDSVHDYLTWTILHSAGNKGGGGVLLQPFVALNAAALWSTALWPVAGLPSITLARFFLLGASLVFCAYLWRRQPMPYSKLVLILTIAATATQIQQFYVYVRTTSFPSVLSSIGALLTLVIFAMCSWVVVRATQALLNPDRREDWNSAEILLLIPLGQAMSASMSSGGTHFDNLFSAALFFTLLTIVSPVKIHSAWLRNVIYCMAALFAALNFSYRVIEPFSWHTYVEKPMFANRVLYHHPEYGYMIIDRDLLNMAESVCNTITRAGGDRELLSIPMPYANYFCSVPPWRGYVQTFFDITDKGTIDEMIAALKEKPPKWILLQNEPGILRLHEDEFNHHMPLAQHRLNQLIEENVVLGEWNVVYRNNLYDTEDRVDQPGWENQWFLIQTR